MRWQGAAIAVLFCLVLVSSHIQPAAADDDWVQKISNKVAGWLEYSSQPSAAESYSVAAETAEESREAHQRRLQFGEGTWWGAAAENGMRAWQYWGKYSSTMWKMLWNSLEQYAPAKVAQWAAPAKSQAERAAGAAGQDANVAASAVGGTAQAAHEKAAGAWDGANAAVDEGLDALAQKAKEVREGVRAAGDAALGQAHAEL